MIISPLSLEPSPPCLLAMMLQKVVPSSPIEYIGLIGVILVTYILVRVQQGNKTIIILEETFYFFLNIPICSVVEVLQLLTLS